MLSNVEKAACGLNKQELRDALTYAFAQKQRWAARCLELVRQVEVQDMARRASPLLAAQAPQREAMRCGCPHTRTPP
jgi:hypothetical protein